MDGGTNFVSADLLRIQPQTAAYSSGGPRSAHPSSALGSSMETGSVAPEQVPAPRPVEAGAPPDAAKAADSGGRTKVAVVPKGGGSPQLPD